MAETTSQLQQKLMALTNGKVNIMLNADEFKSTTQILREMAAVWQDMTDVQQAAALELLGGKRQANILSSLLQNFQTVEDVIQTSMASSGSAIAENEKWLDSIEGKTQQFTNALQTMWSHIIDSEAVKRFVGFGTNLIELLDTTHGKIIALVAAIKLAAKFKNVSIGGVAKGFMQSLQQLRIAQSALSALPKADSTNGSYIYSNINAYAASVSNLVPRLQAQALASKGLNDEQIRLAMSANGVDEANIKLALSQTKVISATQQRIAVSGQEATAMLAAKNIALSDTAQQWILAQSKNEVTKASIEQAIADGVLTKQEGAQIIAALGLTSANFSLAESFKAIGAGIMFAFSTNPIGFLISLASTVLSVVGVFKLFGDTAEDATQKIDSAIASADEIDSTRKSVEEYKDSIEELRAKLADSTISEQEAYDARAQLIDIQNQLIDKFGLEAEGINLVTGAIEEQIDAIDELLRKNAEDWLNDNIEAYVNAQEVLSEEHDTKTKLNDFLYTKEYNKLKNDKDSPERQKMFDEFSEKSSFLTNEFATKIESLGGEYSVNRLANTFTGEIDRYIKFEGKTVEEIDAIFTELMNYVRDYANKNNVDYSGLLSILSEQRKEYVDEDYLEVKELYDKGRQQEAISEYGLEYGAILDAQEEFYQSTTDKSKLESIKKYNQEVADAFVAAGGTIGEDGVFKVDEESSNAHMQKFFADMQNKFNQEEFELKIKADEDGLRSEIEGIIKSGGENGLSALDDNQIRDMISKGLNKPQSLPDSLANNYGYTEAQVKGLKNLQTAADNAGVSIDNIITILTNLGLIAGHPVEQAAESVEAVGQAYSILAASAEKYASINDILNESIYDNIAISEEQYDALKDLIGSEEEFADCIDTSNGYVVKNTSLLKKLVTEKKKAQAADVKLAKSQARLEYYKLVKQLNSTLNSTKDLNKETREAVYATLDQIDAVDQAIYKYQLLEDSLLGATNAFEEFAKAQELDALNTYGDSYVEMAQTMYDAFYKTGQVGTEAFWAATEALVPRIEYAGLESDAEKIKAIFDYFRKSIAPTLQLDEDEFSINYKAIEEFIEDGLSVGVFKGNTTEFDLVEGMNLEKAAELMGMTKAQAYALFAELDKYNFSSDEPSFLSQLDDSLEGRIMRITSNLEELNKQKLALLEDGGYEKNKEAIDGINTEIQKTTTELNKAGKEAYDMWKQYTENEAALASLEAIEDKQTQLTKEQATTWGVEWDEEKGLTVQQAYDMLLEKKTKLEEPTVMTAELAIENIFSQIGQLERLLQNYDQLTTIALKFDISEEELKEKINTRISQLKEDAASMAATFGIDLNEEDQQTIEEQLESIEEIEIHDKRFKVVATGLSSTLNQVRELLRLSKELADMDTPSTSGSESTGFYVSNGYHPTGSGGRTMKYADGTFHIPNSAFADGSVGAPKTETALVGELGPEMLVRNGRWTTIGENGAEFTQVKKNDIIE